MLEISECVCATLNNAQLLPMPESSSSRAITTSWYTESTRTDSSIVAKTSTKHGNHPYHLQRLNATNPNHRLSRVEDGQELLAGDARSGGLDGSLLSLADELLSAEGLGVRVKTEENGLVSEGVLLLGERPWYVSSTPNR